MEGKDWERTNNY